MRITGAEIESRKALFSLLQGRRKGPVTLSPSLKKNIDKIIDDFYDKTSVSEIALLIGDSDTFACLRTAQRRYVLDLFNGVYDLEYVNNRPRIGLVHKRIGVEPKLYLSAVHTLKELIYAVINCSGARCIKANVSVSRLINWCCLMSR